MEDLKRYLEGIVDPTIRDFADNPTSVRHAYLACVAVFHSIDYLAYPRSSRTLRQNFRKLSPDFKLVDHVAHAFKHVTTGRRGATYLKADDVISRPAGAFDVAVFDLSVFDVAEGGVTLDNDRNIDLLETVRRAAEFLRQTSA